MLKVECIKVFCSIEDWQADNGWLTFLKAQMAQPYFQSLDSELKKRATAGALIYPPKNDIFNAYKFVQPKQVKVVILGQDPYHGPNQAHGLSFSVLPGQKIPPSLRNMFKELKQEYPDFDIPKHGDLTNWAKQGVLLLNATLTVEDSNPNVHQHLGWQSFTDATIEYINEHCEDVVFLLWGAFAQKKAKMIDEQRHHILKSAHPSPLSARRGFFGNDHFKTTNELLFKSGKQPINWQLPNV